MSESLESEAPPLEQRELESGLSAARLQGRVKWGGLLLLFSFLVPYEVIDGQPQFVWDVLGELGWGARIAAFVLSLAGALILAGAKLSPNAGRKALVVLTTFASVLIVSALGAEASAWDVLSVPDALGNRPALLILTFAFAGAGSTLAGRGREQTRRGRFLLFASPVCAIPLYVIPVDGTMPVVGVFELLRLTFGAEDPRYQLGYGLIALTALTPALASALASMLALRPPRRELVLPPLLLTYSLPAMLSFFVLRQFFLSLGNSSVLASALGLLPLVAGLGLSSAALEVLAGGELPSKKDLSIAGASLAVASACMWTMSIPPEKGVNWTLKANSDGADTVFGKALGDWNYLRRRWAMREKANEEASAKEYVAVRKAGTDLLKSATQFAPGLAPSFRDLVFETRDLDLAGRRWFRLIHELNASSQKLGLPYYVDPTVDVVRRKSGRSLLFDLEPYRIESVRPFAVDGDEYATLHVRALGQKRRNHSLLGFSRDIQPFALVALDVIEPYAKKLLTWATASPPTCFSADLEEHPRLEFCGKQLQKLNTSPGELKRLTIAATERHELQHQIDGPSLHIANRVNDRMGPYVSWARDDVNRELSAHVAEITAEAGAPHLSLLQVYGNAYRGRPRGKYTHASVLTMEALLGRAIEGAGGKNRGLSRKNLTAAYKELAALSPESLRKRAAGAWEELYGDELPTVARQ